MIDQIESFIQPINIINMSIMKDFRNFTAQSQGMEIPYVVRDVPSCKILTFEVGVIISTSQSKNASLT